ncbi:MAG: ABC transporter ATP-binding protein [Gemmatimonadota bacterium]
MSRLEARLALTLGDFSVDVDLQADAEVVALIGPNGSGKTSMLRAIAGLEPCSEARVVIDGVTVADTSAGVDLPPEQRRVGYVPQGYGLFPHLDVTDNVAFGLNFVDPPPGRHERTERAMGVLRELDCDHLADRGPKELSGGEQQRVALARALVIEPQALLLDEPIAALDAITGKRVRAVLAARLRAFDHPTIVTTHDVRDVESLGAHVVAVEHGRIVQEGSLSGIRTRPATDFIAAFVGS